jgi:hypothetical protein
LKKNSHRKKKQWEKDTLKAIPIFLQSNTFTAKVTHKKNNDEGESCLCIISPHHAIRPKSWLIIRLP